MRKWHGECISAELKRSVHLCAAQLHGGGNIVASLIEQRRTLVEKQLKGRGITDPRVLSAFESVRREAFLPPELEEFAYLDTPLPIEQGQTISQPYIVALMAQAAAIKPGDRVLEVGTGSGYAAAVLAKIANEVYTIERHGDLAEQAAHRLIAEGFENVDVMNGDGTLGWIEHAPYDAIIVAAGGPTIPTPLLDQLATGGRLVIPVGEEKSTQKLIRVTRMPGGDLRREELCDVRFVPLIGAGGWQDGLAPQTPRPTAPPKVLSRPSLVSELIREVAEPISSLTDADLGAVIERVGNARLILIGEASHGTSEFYRIRAEITKALIQRGRIHFVAVEADWPDAARLDQYVRGNSSQDGHNWQAFERFPTWMWRNREVLEFIEWLREFNASIDEPQRRVGFHGLDLYSMYTSIHAVLDYLDRVDRDAARVARLRYSCLTPWESDPATYGRLAVSGRYRVCEDEVVATLVDLLKQRLSYSQYDGARFMDAVQNARVVVDAERYYRAMYYGGNESWNLRDHHMFETLQLLLGFYGSGSAAAVWEHNSHLGDATHTQMGASGQTNVGRLCREAFGPAAYLIGQGTDHGTVAAASNWDEPVQFMNVRPSHADSYERLCHESKTQAFFLPLREPRRAEVRAELSVPRLERAIGVIYRPDTELASHYFHANLADQFDEYIWFDRSQAVHPLTTQQERNYAPDHPFSYR
jgi:protein-L-isoaspartate(D-aspartate) O-methyltransferase